jgi:hypothetical protein
MPAARSVGATIATVLAAFAMPRDCGVRASSRLISDYGTPYTIVPMVLDLLRLTVAFGGVALLVLFWYWLMDSIGTF